MPSKFYTICICLGLTASTFFGIEALSRVRQETTECTNFFNDQLSTEYHHQLTSLLATQQSEEMLPLVASLSEENSNLILNKRLIHQQFTEQLRRELKKQTAKSYAGIDNVVSGLFLQIDLSKEMGVYLFNLIPAPSESENFSHYLINAQNQLYTYLHARPYKQNHISWEDQFYSGNIPQRIPVEGITLVRMAQPLIDYSILPWWLSKPQISPEFKRFLELQPSHLYVNLMRRNGKERILTSGLEVLEEKFPQLHVVTLDRDSDFYWQKGSEDKENVDSGIFKSAFLEDLNGRNGHYYWSRHLDPREWKKQLETLVENVHQQHFNKQLQLTKLERLNFIELAHLAILDALTTKLAPASMNITCHQAMDRAPALLTAWLWQRQAISKIQFATLLLAPPIIIHNRASHLSRIERLTALINAGN